MKADDPLNTATVSADGLPSKAPQTPATAATAVVLPIESGTTLKHYEVIRHIGRGGMGDVYLARDMRLGRLVALKLLIEVTASERFIAEARVTAGLAHDNIVGLFDIDEYGGTPYMVLEYVPGRTFKELLWGRAPAPPQASFAPLPVEQAVELMIPVLRALVHAHAAGIVHRDLKPSNLMLAHDGSVKVLDFGIAKIMGGTEPAAATQGSISEFSSSTPSETIEGAVLGSRPYMSPEQWARTRVDHRSDLWAVGVVLCEMVTGRRPFAELSLDQLRNVVLDLSTETPSVRTTHPHLGPVAAIIDRCLVKNVEERVQSAGALLGDLESLARGGTASGGEPYPGLATFQETDAPYFHGRERDIAELCARLLDEPLVVVVGRSGAGKSSFMRAGVVPRLKRSGEAWDALIVRPGRHPLAALAELLRQHSVDAPVWEATAVAERLEREPGYFGADLRRHARRTGASLLLFVDQCEELYTLATAEQRHAFLDCLAGAADDVGAPIRIVLGLRSDFLDRLTDAPRAMLDRISRNTILLRPLERTGLRSALVKPAESAGYRFETTALVDGMVDELEHHAGALPVLQFTAARLWELRDRERRLLTEASYRAIGGIAGALASHADAVIASLRSSEYEWARAIFLRLVTAERTRTILSMRELRELGRGAPEIDQVLVRLIDSRLLTSDRTNEDQATIEIVHESLIDGWPLLGRWIDEEHEDAGLLARLRSAARDWEVSGHAEGLLWRGDAAKAAERWYRERRDATVGVLGTREEKFLQSVIALSQRSGKRRALFMGGAMSALVIAVAVVSSFAVQQSRAAMRARDATRVAAARLQANDPTTQLALLRSIEGTPPPGWAADVKHALHAGVARVVYRGHDNSVRWIGFSPDGRRVATASADQTVQVWNVDGSGTPLVLRHAGFVSSGAFSPDGRHLAAGAAKLTLWNADGSGAPRILTVPGAAVRGVAYSPDGKRVVACGSEVRLWNADGSGSPLVLPGRPDSCFDVAFSPDGRLVAATSDHEGLRIWNADGASPPRVVSGHTSSRGVAFSPDGKTLAFTSHDARLFLWTIDSTSEPVAVPTGTGSITQDVTFSPDGRFLAAATSRTVSIWRLDALEQPPRVLSGHSAPVFAVAFSPDGRLLGSASHDNTARIWNLEDPTAPIVIHDRDVTAAGISPDGRRVVVASGQRVRLWNGDGWGAPVDLGAHDASAVRALFSPDGRQVASSSLDRTVRLWKPDAPGVPIILRGHTDVISALAYSPDGRRLASGSYDRTVRIWNADGTGQPVVLPHPRAVKHVAFSADGRRLASGSDDGMIRVWNGDGSGQPVALDVGGPPAGVSLSPDGNDVVFAVAQKLAVWHVDGKLPPRTLAALTVPVVSPLYSPDGRSIVSATSDGTVHVWDAAGAGERIALIGHSGMAWPRQFSRDGRLVTASEDDTVRVWRDFTPVQVDEPLLWSATNECLSVDREESLLGLAEPFVVKAHQRCLARVAAGRR